MEFNVLYLLFISVSFSLLLPAVECYKKCCSADEELSDDRTSCVRKYSENTVQSLADSLGFEIQGAQDGSVGFPACTKLESLKISDLFKVATNGGKEVLITPKYNDPVSGDKFCIDTVQDEIYAVTCDQCEGKICIHLCCPFGQQLKEFDYDEYSDMGLLSGSGEDYYDTADIGLGLPGDLSPCEPSDSQFTYKLNFLTQENQPVSWNLGAEYMVIGPQHKDEIEGNIFQCPIDDISESRPIWLETEFHESRNLSLHTDGYLRGALDHNHLGNPNATDDVKFLDLQVDHFCVGFKKGEEQETQIKVSYQNCHFEVQNNACEKARWTVFNIAFFVSIIFLIGAIIAHLIEPQLRDSTFGKISMMYLTNILLYFIFIVIDRFGDAERGSGGCIAIGYFQQYFNLGFFFWISAMAFFFFVGLERLSPRTVSGSKKLFIALFVYAQGMPLLICIITVIVDEVRKYKETYPKDYPDFDPHMYPEMGLFGCYLGYQQTGPRPSYFSTPEFLYVQMYQLIILLTNLGMFVKTAIYIVKTRKQARTGHESYHKENFLILIKLFVYMLCVWILEIVTSAIAAEHGINDTCPIRFVLDLPNAFYGVIIFLVLVCSKPPIRRSLRRKVSEMLTRPDSSANSGGNNIETLTMNEDLNSLTTTTSTTMLTK